MNRIIGCGDALSSIVEKRRIRLLLLLLCSRVVVVVVLTYTLYMDMLIYLSHNLSISSLKLTNGFLLKDNRMPPLTELDNGLP